MMPGGMFREDGIDGLINCHKCVTWMQDVNNGENWLGVVVERGEWKLSLLSLRYLNLNLLKK